MGSVSAKDRLAETLVMILAGGQGERLYPLTRHRAKPAVPFAANFRIIDFSLSNCVNSGLRRIHVLTQYKSDSLSRHIWMGWNIFSHEVREYIDVRPPQQRMSSHWYKGTADAIYQNLYSLQRERPSYVLILAGDHVYAMDYRRLLNQHVESSAALTIACNEQPVETARKLGVVKAGEDGRVEAFKEKPQDPAVLAHPGDIAVCSMGIYVFTTEPLVRRLVEDSKVESQHDFGKNIIPAMVKAGDRVFTYNFTQREAPRDYWRDIGTLDAYWEANMDMVKDDPGLDLYDPDWPFRSRARHLPPARMSDGGEATRAPDCEIHDSLMANGGVVRGASLTRCVVGPNVFIDCGSRIEDTVIMGDVRVGQNVSIRRAVIDKDNCIPDNATIGLDHERDRLHLTVSDGGTVVVAKGMHGL